MYQHLFAMQSSSHVFADVEDGPSSARKCVPKQRQGSAAWSSSAVIVLAMQDDDDDTTMMTVHLLLGSFNNLPSADDHIITEDSHNKTIHKSLHRKSLSIVIQTQCVVILIDRQVDKQRSI